MLPGNKEFSPGDRHAASPARAAARRPDAADAGDCEDDFRFVLSREEVLDLFFEDLELPDMVKLNLKEILAFKPRRAGFATTGAPTNINVGRTMRNSYGRRIALKRPQRKEIDAIRQEIAELEAAIAEPSGETAHRGAASRIATGWNASGGWIAYVDPVDIRFNRFERQPVPNVKAVMFCLMDVSGSMGEREKDLAKRFFVLLHLFLKRRYDRTEIVFIRHTHEAAIRN